MLRKAPGASPRLLNVILAVEFRKRLMSRRMADRYAAQIAGLAGGLTMSDASIKPAGTEPAGGFLERQFKLSEHGTNVRTEFIAGATTFLTMAYILFVNPIDPGQGRHGPGRGVRRDLHCVCGVDPGDGVLRQLSDRACARHGAQRVLRLHRGARLQIHVAAGAGGGVLLGRAVLCVVAVSGARIHHRRDPAKPEACDLGGRRPVPRHHRARGSQARGGASGDAGHARRSQAMAGDPVPPGLRADRRAQLSAR